MRLFYKGKDGGKDSTVTGYWLIEIKGLFSIVLLHFADGTRENYHTHAFNAWTWFIKGKMYEQLKGTLADWEFLYSRSLKPKYTPREKLHRVRSVGSSWCLSIRGPWQETWQEYNEERKELITLTNGRHIISKEKVNG